MPPSAVLADDFIVVFEVDWMVPSVIQEVNVVEGHVGYLVLNVPSRGRNPGVAPVHHLVAEAVHRDALLAPISAPIR